VRPRTRGKRLGWNKCSVELGAGLVAAVVEDEEGMGCVEVVVVVVGDEAGWNTGSRLGGERRVDGKILQGTSLVEENEKILVFPPRGKDR
jgi:hypothetical protein